MQLCLKHIPGELLFAVTNKLLLTWSTSSQSWCLVFTVHPLLFQSHLTSLSVSLQLKQPDKAAAAAHTYFQANPEHVEMGENLEQYKDLQGVQEDDFVDREAQPHQVSHKSLLYETFCPFFCSKRLL